MPRLRTQHTTSSDHTGAQTSTLWVNNCNLWAICSTSLTQLENCHTVKIWHTGYFFLKKIIFKSWKPNICTSFSNTSIKCIFREIIDYMPAKKITTTLKSKEKTSCVSLSNYNIEKLNNAQINLKICIQINTAKSIKVH